MSVILDALKKAQDERKRPVYRDSGSDEQRPGKSRWAFYVIVGVVLCAILLVAFLPSLYRMQAPSGPQVVRQKEVTVPPPPVAPPQPVAPPAIAPPKAPSEAQLARRQEPPRREELPKFAVATPRDYRTAGDAEEGLPEKKIRRRAPGRDMRAAAKAPGQQPETVSQKGAPAPQKTAQPMAPVEQTPESSVVVKRMTNDRIMTNYNNAVLAAQQGNNQQAKKLYLAVLADEPGNIEALNNLGVLAMEEGNTKEAASYFRRILEYRKNYAKAYNNLGIIGMREGDKNIAEEYFKKAIEVAPQGIEPYVNLAALLRSERRLDEASRVIEAPLKRGLRNEQLYLSAALIKDEMGQSEEAAKYYRYYLQMSSSKEDRRRVIERLTSLEESKSATSP